jgi:hypothetical protein
VCVQLRTNRGREVIFGEGGRDWERVEPMEPAEDETIVGLAVGLFYAYVGLWRKTFLMGLSIGAGSRPVEHRVRVGDGSLGGRQLWSLKVF